jgi:sigma-E factor negative regulatory protein RseA
MSEQNQSQSFAESLSALMDNQASELELQRILKASEQDPGVKATWSRYQMASAVIRGEPTSLAMPDFAARISAAIEQETAVVVAAKPNQGLWHKLGQVALVASVAGVMIVGVQQYNRSGSHGVEMASNVVVTPNPSVAEPLAPTLPSGFNSPAINTRTVAVQTGYETRPQENRRVMFQPRQAGSVVSDDDVTRYVNQMIQAHSDNAAMNSGQGVLPYARVIMTDEE